MATTSGLKNICVNYWIADGDLAFCEAFSIVSETKLEKLLNTATSLFSANLFNKDLKN